MKTTPGLIGIVALLSACSTIPALAGNQVAKATLTATDGRGFGTAIVAERAGLLQLEVQLSGLAPGRVHGFHLHATGKCQGPAYASAGGHLNPLGRQHGVDNPGGSHLGDLPNLLVDGSGTARLTVALPGLGEQIRAQIMDADGTAIVIHADPDDLRTDPTGNSGARIACGVFLQVAP